MLRQGLGVFAKNKRRVSDFYRQTLGLACHRSEPSHDLLRGPGVEVAVRAIRRRDATRIRVATPPEPRDRNPSKPTFFVGSLAHVRRAAEATGGYLKPQAGAEDAGFHWVTMPGGVEVRGDELFDPAKMRELFALGYEMARRGPRWQTRPPGYERVVVGAR